MYISRQCIGVIVVIVIVIVILIVVVVIIRGIILLVLLEERTRILVPIGEVKSGGMRRRSRVCVEQRIDCLL